MKQEILRHLTECPWRDTLYWFDTIDSTNTRAKKMAAEGAPHGTVLVAGAQTGGRGRLGRSFQSPQGMGVYLSVILRPKCPPDALMHLTCAAAVAMLDAIRDCAGFVPGIKWTNDLVCGKKKLGGILTELAVNPQTHLVDSAVIGIGINCLQKDTDFPHEISDIATSLSISAGRAISPARLAASMVSALHRMDGVLLTEKDQILQKYRRCCITLGQNVSIVKGDAVSYGKAVDLDEDGALIVQRPDGSIETVQSGEVSVRGMYGYI